jgi:hypothetical protein
MKEKKTSKIPGVKPAWEADRDRWQTCTSTVYSSPTNRRQHSSSQSVCTPFAQGGASQAYRYAESRTAVANVAKAAVFIQGVTNVATLPI